MNKKFLINIAILLIIAGTTVQAQGSGDPNLLKIGFHTGNRAGISFYNDGQIAGFRQGVDIRGEWPLGSGENYIGDCIPLIGIEFTNNQGEKFQSVTISRGPRNRQGEERHPILGYFWGFNPMPGYVNPKGESVAMSHLQNSWPVNGWADPGEFPEVVNYVNEDGKTDWWGFFGRGIMQADQESYFIADDQKDDEFNANFKPDANDLLRNGMALQLRQRGFQWSSFLAEDAIFWLYDIKNEGTTNYQRADFGTVIGTLAGGDGDSGDDLGFFDTEKFITYSWDSDGIGNKGQKVGYIGYAFLESPGNPFDGIDNDGDSDDPSSPKFNQTNFLEITHKSGSKVVLINPDTYERTVYTIATLPDTVYSLGRRFIIDGVNKFREGHIASISNGVAIPDSSAFDGYDNDLDGLIDENESLHLSSRQINKQDPVKYINYLTGAGLFDKLIDEKRDNDIDEDGDWDVLTDDIGQDGLGPNDTGYPGPDFGEADGIPTQGEPNFGRTDPDESDQIGLTAFNFFNLSASPDMTNDSLLWARMTPGRFDEIAKQPQDGDFIYASGYFPLIAGAIERFSVALLFGEDLNDIKGNQVIVQQIYNSGYKFPQPPRKPKITISQSDGNVVIYWDREVTENTKDFITKKRDFQGYKIYRATDAGFQDARQITNALGVLSFDKPIAQYDLVDSIKGYYYPTPGILQQVGGITYFLGDNTGVVNKFVDSTVTPGLTYYYAVVAYDSGDEGLEIFPSENSKFIFRDATGEIIIDDNTGYITPGRRPSGYDKAAFTDYKVSDTYKATGRIDIEIVDDSAIRDNFKYQIAFRDTSLRGLTQDYSLIDLQTPDTVFVPLANETYIVNPLDSIALPIGSDTLLINGLKRKVTGSYYKAPYDTLINRSNVLAGNTKIAHGFRPQIYNDAQIKQNVSKSSFTGFSSATPPSYTFTPFLNIARPVYSGIGMPYDYEIEFFDSNVSQSIKDTIDFPPISKNVIQPRAANFKVKNVTTGQEIDFSYWTTGGISTTHNIIFKETIQGQYKRTWRVNITYISPNQPLETSGLLKLVTSKPFSRDDVIEFTMKGATLNKAVAKDDLDEIKVVPNPYVVTHKGEGRLLSSQTSGRGEREIRFTYIPPGSKISIFTVRGELIRTLNHDNLYVGDVFWNLRTEENIDAAYGVYIYVVEVPGVGKKIGKFALIK
ncbi:MAG: hypothetical protein KJ799_10250 [Bacteroidetes bacterium]|nr:hypothetical protein [Bacteroidota bacterium]